MPETQSARVSTQELLKQVLLRAGEFRTARLAICIGRLGAELYRRQQKRSIGGAPRKEKIDEAEQLRQSGLSYPEIFQRMGISNQQARHRIRNRLPGICMQVNSSPLFLLRFRRACAAVRLAGSTTQCRQGPDLIGLSGVH